ncbi:sulfite exporter TauE/SafE family protein, partial [Vibrio lentus]
SASIAGLVDRDVVWLTIILLPSSMFGGYVGSKLFERFGGEKFKPVTIALLVVIAIFSAGRVLV